MYLRLFYLFLPSFGKERGVVRRVLPNITEEKERGRRPSPAILSLSHF
jgi:hypothetical protein